MKKNPVELVRQGKPAESPLEVLERTRRLFGYPGTWVRGRATGPSSLWDKRRCLSEALGDCDGTHVTAAQGFALSAIKELYPKEKMIHGSIATFNDRKSTTKLDVVRVLDRAIDLAKEES